MEPDDTPIIEPGTYFLAMTCGTSSTYYVGCYQCTGTHTFCYTNNVKGYLPATGPSVNCYNTCQKRPFFVKLGECCDDV